MPRPGWCSSAKRRMSFIPIAGQGLNLRIRDVAALAELLIDWRRLGLDIGDDRVLQRYERWRRFDTWMLAAATDGLNRLLSNRIAPLRMGWPATSGLPWSTGCRR